MPISLNSPNVENYSVGKGIVALKFEGDPDFVDAGNVSEFELTANLETLDHFSSRQGVREKDRSIIIQKSLELRMVLNEATARNMGVMLLGTPVITGDHAEIDILSENVRVAAVRFTGNNDIGPKWSFNLPRVEFKPSSALQPLSEEWMEMECTGEVVAVAGSFGTAESDFVDVIPANTVLPHIITDGSPAVGETLNSFVGVWTGSPATYTYQWKNATVAIPGATGATYVPVAGDSGDSITLTVTAHNGAGNVAATSAAVVIA